MAGAATTPTTTESYTSSLPLTRAFVYAEDGGLPFAARIETDNGWPKDLQTNSTLDDPLEWLFFEINKAYGYEIDLAVFAARRLACSRFLNIISLLANSGVCQTTLTRLVKSWVAGDERQEVSIWRQPLRNEQESRSGDR